MILLKSILASTQDACYARVKPLYLYPVRDYVLGRPKFDFKWVVWTCASGSSYLLNHATFRV